MKKVLAVLCVFATLFALAACKNKEKELTEEERLASLHASQEQNRIEMSQQVEHSIKQEIEIQSDKKNTLENLGKTEKDKQIVFLSDGEYPGMKEGYQIIKFDGSGKFESWLQYIYYPTTEAFDRALAYIKDDGNFAYETSDASMRVIVYRYTNEKYLANEKYDDMLQRVRDFGYTVVE